MIKTNTLRRLTKWSCLLLFSTLSSYTLKSQVVDYTTDIVGCSGANRGKVTVTITGGTPRYNYFIRSGGILGSPLASKEFTLDTFAIFQNLNQGTYGVIVYDNDAVAGSPYGTFVDAFEFAITYLGFDPITVVKGLTCYDGNDAELQANPKGGVPPYSYAWSNGDNTQIATGISQGIYSVTITDQKTCQVVSTILFFRTYYPGYIPSQITVSSTTTGTCQGASTGTITVNGSGGTGDLDYAIVRVATSDSTFQETNVFTNLAAGTYRVYVIDNNGCIARQVPDAVVTEFSNPVASASSNSPVCVGSPLNLTGLPNGMTSYSWSGPNGFTSSQQSPQVSPSATLAMAGNYTLVVTNGNGCTDSDVTTVVVNALPSPTASNNGPVCAGQQLQVFALPNGMTSYAWSGPNGFTSNQQNPIVSPNATTAMSGIYTVTVTDGNGCSNTATTNAVVYALPAVTASSNSPVCVGSPLNLIGGPAGMTSYSWTGPNGFTSNQQNPQVSPSATLAMAGVYTLTVVDGNGCSNSANTTVVVITLPIVTASSNSPVCEGDVLNLGCTPNGMLSYSWSGPNGFTSNQQNPTVSASATLAMAGDYTVTVTDANGCSNTATTTVTIEVAPVVDAGPNNSICFGDTLFITNATASNYSSLLWTSSSGYNGFSNNTIINPYYVPGSTDQANGQVTLYLIAFGNGPCGSAIDSMILILPTQIQVSVGSISPFIVGPNTEIEVCVTYEDHLVVQDLSYFLQAPDGITIIPLKEVENPGGMCNFFGGPGSSVDLCFTTELTDDDTLTICDPGFWRDISGNYAATGDWSTFYGQNPADGGWSIVILDYLATEGSGNPDGRLTHASISFIDTSIFTNELTTIQFESGVADIPIIEGDGFTPGGVTYAVPLGLRTSCAGECDALAMVIVTGGTPPYIIYDWDDPLVPDEDSVFLCEGVYNITVTDAMGCTGSTSITVISPPPILFDEINYTDTLDCFGESNGFISVQASGGTGTLIYTLLPDIPSETADSGYFSGLSAGIYTIHVEDANGCYHDTTLTIYQPNPLLLVSAEVTDSVFCAGDTNGRIVATASGGTQPYTFILEPVGISNNTGIFNNLGPGSYIVRLTDANDCDTIDSETLILGVPIPLVIDTVIVDPILCYGETGTMTVVVIGGRAPYDVSVNGTPEQSGIVDTAIIIRGPGNWNISVADANACTASWPTITLTDPPALVLDSIVTTPITTCYTDPVGEIAVYASGGTGTIEYSINGIDYQSANLFTGLTGGSYTVYYRDANGCTETANTVIPGPPLLLGNPIVTHVEGDNLGSILLNPTGGTPFPAPDEYRYSIDGGPLTTDPLFDDLTAGTYQVHVEDANGCPWDSTIIIEVRTLDVTIIVIDADCYGVPTGEIRIYMNDGIPPYTIYFAEMGDPLQVIYSGVMENFRTIPSVYPGDYAIRVEDFNSRRFDDTVTVNSPPPISYSVSSTQVSCYEYTLDGGIPSDGGISINDVTGGVGNYTYTWNDIGEAGPARENLRTGLYIVTISDENDCPMIDSTNLVGQDTIDARINLYIIDPNRLMDTDEILNYPSTADDTLCYGSNWGLLATYNYIPIDTLAWSPDSVLDNPDDYDLENVSITMRYPMIIRLTVTNYRCMDYDVINLFMFDTIGMYIETDAYRVADSIFDPEGKPLNLSAPDGYSDYLWLADDEFEDDEAQNAVLTPFADQDVMVIGTTPDRCYEWDTVFIVIQRPIGDIFDVFTPNDDGFNDYWNIPNALQYPHLEVLIFDRWGQQVFYSKPYGIDEYHTWDGKSQKNGKNLPIGSYYYIIKPNDGEQEPISGTVTIVR